MEAKILFYFRQNHTQIRTGDYTLLRDRVWDSGHAQDESDSVQARERFNLSSTYIGGDNYVRQQMYDTITLSNQIGHMDILFTVIWNSNCPDMKRAILPEEILQTNRVYISSENEGSHIFGFQRARMFRNGRCPCVWVARRTTEPIKWLIDGCIRVRKLQPGEQFI